MNMNVSYIARKSLIASIGVGAGLIVIAAVDWAAKKLAK